MTEEEHLRLAVTSNLAKISMAIDNLIMVEQMHHQTSQKLLDRLNEIEAKIDSLKGA